MTIAGAVDEISRRRIVGWAFDSDVPEANLPIAIYVDDREFGHCTANLFREGLKEELGDGASGQYGFEFTFDPPLSVFMEYRVRVSVADQPEPLPRGARTLPRPAIATAHLVPVIVTSTGRAGTTLLMSELAQRPEIVVAGDYPFEIKLVAYYSLAFRTLVSAEDRINSTDPVTMFAPENRFKIGHNPYNFPDLYRTAGMQQVYERFYERVVPDGFSRLFGQLIEEYYSLVKAGQGKGSARFFAEKGDIDEAARLGVRQFFDRVCELVVVRDPRDTLCSAMNFWKMRPAEALEMLKTTLPQLVKISRAAAADNLFIRYEDLVAEPVTVRREIYRFLGIEHQSRFSPEADPTLFQRHGTSTDPAASVGRWQQELGRDLVAECDASFGLYMERFGYERGTRGSRTATGTLSKAGQIGGARVLTGYDAAQHFSATRDAAQAAPIFEITFGTAGSSKQYLREGWAVPEGGYTWTAGSECRLEFPRPDHPGNYLLRLLARVFLWQETLPAQRLSIVVNGSAIGSVVARGEIAVVECDLPWTVLERHESVTLSFLVPDAARPSEVTGTEDDRLLAFCFERLEIVPVVGQGADCPTALSSTPAYKAAAAAAAEATLAVSDLLARFESLGENCEFGLVQRRCGAEPLGLFRFASAPLLKLLAGLEAGFEGLSEPENLDVQLSSNGQEYMVHDRKFQLLYHAWVLADEMTAEEVRHRESRRLPLLVRKLVDDLRQATKIFVFHGMEPLSEQDAQSLLAHLLSYGPNTLLWVELADADHPAGTVAWHGRGLLKGYIDRFAPGENAHDLSLDCWIAICREAYRLARIDDVCCSASSGLESDAAQ